YVPEKDRGAAVPRRQDLAVRRKGQGGRVPWLSVEASALASGRHLPEPDGQPAPGRQRPGVGRKSQGQDVTGVPRKLAKEFARGDFPQTGSAVLAARSEEPAGA